MPNRAAWSQDDAATLAATLRAIIAADFDTTSTTVYIGRATQGAAPPFVVCWPLVPHRTGEGLAGDDWGLVLEEWQVAAHGRSIGEARMMGEWITGSDLWPDGWELVDVGPMVEDTDDRPTTWFRPVTFRNTSPQV